jgi:tetratricopeptide (TPR) repeat protein
VAKFSVSKKKLLVGLGIIVLVGAAIGAGVLWQWYQNGNSKTPTIEAKNKLPQSVTKAEDLYTTGKTDEAQKSISDALNNSSTSSDEKYLLYMSQANFAIDKKDYQGAITIYLKAQTIKDTYDLARRLGATYQQMGNNTKAIEYYKKARTLNPKDNPLHDRDDESLVEMIRAIGGQP